MVPVVDTSKKPGSLIIPFNILALLILVYQFTIGNIPKSIIIIGLVIAFLFSYVIFKRPDKRKKS
ncbi:MAG: hypothetical protein AABW89_03460 [Nanoarchaeota archaeon]